MRAAVALRDVVGEAEHVLVIAVVPPHRAFDADAVVLGRIIIGCGHQRGVVAVEIFHEGLDAALVDHLLALLDRVAHVGQNDGTPELRNASSRRRCSSVAKSNSMLLKVSFEARKVTSVPRLPARHRR
jgi:hypothetical protein